MALKVSFHNVSENLYTTSGLSILLHSVISLPDATSYDKQFYTIIFYASGPTVVVKKNTHNSHFCEKKAISVIKFTFFL